MKDAIDSMIESWASGGKKPRKSRKLAESTATAAPAAPDSAAPDSEGAPAPSIEDPKDFNPMTHLPCGHWSVQFVPDHEREPIERSGLTHVFTKSVEVKAPGPETCPACAAGKPGHPQYQSGEWRRPVPPSQRRTLEKSSPSFPGYPGLCADPDTGLYIGGLGNDCSRYNGGPERCIVHASPTPSSSERKGSLP